MMNCRKLSKFYVGVKEQGFPVSDITSLCDSEAAHLSAFESHVLQKVCTAICCIGLVSAPSINPHPNCGCLCERRGLRANSQTAVQAGDLSQGRVYSGRCCATACTHTD
jgi:hypothetical protein